MSKAVITGAAAATAAVAAITFNQAVNEQGKRKQTALSITRDHQACSWTRIKEGLWDDAVSFKDALLLRGIYNDNTAKYIERGRDDLAQQISDSVKSSPPPQLQRSVKGRNVFSSMDEDRRNERDDSQDNKSIFNWGYNDIEKAKAVAIGEFDAANKKYNDILDKWKHSKTSFFSAGDAALKEQVENCKKMLEEKRQALKKASEDFNQYTKQSFNEISNNIDKQDVLNGIQNKKQDLWSWLKDDTSNDGKPDVDKLAAASVVGWGERAQEFAEEELEERRRSMQIGPSEAQRRLDELKKYKENGWFTYRKGDETEEEMAKRVIKGLEGWGETAAQLAREEYEDLKWQAAKTKEEAAALVDDASQKLAEAKSDVDKTASKWWQFGKEKKDEVHEKSLANYEAAKRDYENSKKALQKWTDKQRGNFWDMANDSVSSIQGQVDKAHEVVTDKLDDAKSYTKEKKN